MKSFSNKVAAISGAASGIGRALAIELAGRGCHLALSDIDATGLRETAVLARTQNIKITTAIVDTGDREAVYAWAEQVVATHGRVNLVFNNAGVAISASVEKIKQQDFEWLMNINFWGVVWGTQAFLPHLHASGDGHIVNVSSVFGLLSMPLNGAYNASKFAVRGYTECLRMELELQQAAVSATCVHPGGVKTNIASAARIDPSAEQLTGISTRASNRRAEKALNTTKPDVAALQILRGVEKNKRRVLVGIDAKLADIIVRLLGPFYQIIIVRARRAHRKKIVG